MLSISRRYVPHFIDMPRCLDGLKKICVEGVKNGNFLAVA